MAEVKIVSKSLVQASEHPPADSIKSKIAITCSDLKLILVGGIQKGILFKKPESFSPDLIQRLKSSLSQALNFYYPLAGRLSSVQHPDDTVSYFIESNNAGLLFVHAVAPDLTVSDVLDPIYVPLVVHSFYTLTTTRNFEGVTEPLVGIQVTELSDGIFIGTTMNHCTGDGTTYWNFINSWSDLCRGLDQISQPPIFDNWFRNCTARLPLSVFNAPDDFNPPPLKERVFHFSKEKVAELKARANSEVAAQNVVVSSVQSVLAHIWRSEIRNRDIDPEKVTKLTMQIGLRPRMDPEIPHGYFGNAVQGILLELKARQVIELGLGQVALEVNKAINCRTQELILKDVEAWCKEPKVPTMSDFSTNAFVMSSAPTFNIYYNDFGWGKPIAVRSGPGNKFDGKATVYPAPEPGSMDVELCLAAPILEGMANDLEFMDAVSV